MFLNKVWNKYKNDFSNYSQFTDLPIDGSSVLLEAGQGKNINGNMFALVEELCSNPKWSHLKPVFVVTEETKESARKRFAFYKWKVRLVIRDTVEYKQLLATSKYLFTDNSFPVYFSKRPEQVYLNTWHGTPLKTLGKSDLENAVSLANIQKNYLMCDYALFPNALTERVFMKDYMLENLYQGKIVLADYPRNARLYDKAFGKDLKKTLGLEDKLVYAYMPTWRGTGRQASVNLQKEIINRYLRELDEKLADDQTVLVNLHFLVGNTMDFSTFKHIKAFPQEYETYDVLSACDGLITDYSSVFFDFGVTDKKIILFAYDLEDYMESRGTYFPVESLPFPICRTTEEVVSEINSDKVEDRTAFWNTYCDYRKPGMPEKLLDLVVDGKNDGLTVKEAWNNGKKLLLLYVGNLATKPYNAYLAAQVEKLQEENPDFNVVVVFRGAIKEKEVEFVRMLPETIQFYALVKQYGYTLPEFVELRLSLISNFWYRLLKNHLKPAVLRERTRHFVTIQPDLAYTMSRHSRYMDFEIESFPCEKVLWRFPAPFVGTIALTKPYKAKMKRAKSVYTRISNHTNDNVENFYLDEPETYYNLSTVMANLYSHFKLKNGTMEGAFLGVMANTMQIPLDKIQMDLGGVLVHPQMKKRLPLLNGKSLVTYHISVPLEAMESMEIQNKVSMTYENTHGFGLDKGIYYRAWDGHKGRTTQGKIVRIPGADLSAFFRQSKNNLLYLTVRKTNISDAPSQQWKMNAAWLLSRILPKKNIILMFEKESARYEESASVVYEKLMDQGYGNVYFVLDEAYPFRKDIPAKYESHLLRKGSFKHYLNFFRAQTFIGSEMMVHAIDLRVANRHALQKLEDKNLNYVFLQHGVMYMVSLDSESRKFFKPLNLKGKYRVVTSSLEESRHFIELGEYPEEVLYVTGLPKFDKNEWAPDADRIVIMPTWRPWEYNEAHYDFQDTKYYKMLERIVDAIPDHLKEKVTVLVHPLFLDAIKDKDYPLKKYISTEQKYDEILKHAKILITDYSSIAYDAFYRGANVLFYWEEKDECLEHYGPSTKLMLTPENAYGDICMTPADVTAVIEENYTEPQKETYKNRYKKIVQFEDGQNTERLIDLMKQDGIL